jgi:hypothetical protein
MKDSYRVVGSSPVELTPPDRRREVRHAVRVPMRILKVNLIAGDHTGMCTDISRGGLGFETATRLELGSVIEYAFAFAGDQPFRHTARILYRIGSHYGAYSLDGDESAWDEAQPTEDEPAPKTPGDRNPVQ